MKSHRKQSSKIFFLSLLCAELCILCINCDLKAEEPSSRATGGGQSVQKAASDKPIESTRIYAAGETGVEIFKALARNNSKDVCVAPASIASGLITLSLCTAGQTRNEIFQALGVKDQRELLLLHRDLMSSVSAKQPESRISNAVLVSSAVKLQQGFSAVLQSVLETKLIVAKNSDSGRTLLNQWIMGATAGKIGSRDVESQLSGGVTLFSTIYFKGAWEEKFLSGNTRDEAFTLLTGSTKKVPMMSDGGESYYLSTPEAQVLRRSYRSSSRYAMYFFLPKRVAAFKPFLASLSLQKLRTLMNGCQKRSGGVTLPRFRTVCKSDLTEPLKAAGIKSIFSASADFSPMFSSAQKSVSGSPNHTAMIDVNKEGTEAAAITTFPVEMGVDPAAFSFRADHPFVYAVVDGNNDNILLLGTVVDPEDSRVPQAVESPCWRLSKQKRLRSEVYL